MTIIVDIRAITIIAVRNPCIISQDSSNPTVAGINIIGIICTRKCPVSFTADSLMTPVHNDVKSIIIPYMLAGIGSGIRRLSSSPMSDIAKIISNCFMYFIAGWCVKKPPGGGFGQVILLLRVKGRDLNQNIHGYVEICPMALQ